MKATETRNPFLNTIATILHAFKLLGDPDFSSESDKRKSTETRKPFLNSVANTDGFSKTDKMKTTETKKPFLNSIETILRAF